MYNGSADSYNPAKSFILNNANENIQNLSLPTSTPKKPCNHCGQQHWSWTCPMRSEEDKLQDAVNYSIRRGTQKKQVRLTLMNTVYRVSINQDGPCYSAGYDTYSQVHVTPHRHLLTNVEKAEKPIFLNQIHEDYKCVEYGRHPHLNEVVWICSNVPTTIISHSACRDSGHQLSYDADTDIFTDVNVRTGSVMKYYPEPSTGLPKTSSFWHNSEVLTSTNDTLVTKQLFPTSIDSLPSCDGPTDFDVLSRGLSKKEIVKAKEAFADCQRFFRPASTLRMLSEVVQDWPLSQLDYQQSQRLFGTPVDVTRGCSTYVEYIGLLPRFTGLVLCYHFLPNFSELTKDIPQPL